MAIFRDSPYRCEFCGEGLDPAAASSAKRVMCWMKNGSTTARNPGPPLAYAHWTCAEVDSVKPVTAAPKLF